MRVHGSAGKGTVGDPPAHPLPLLHCSKQAEGGGEHQGDHHRVAPSLGRVIDHEGAEGDEGSRNRPAPLADRPGPEQIGERDRRGPCDQGGKPQHLRVGFDLGGQLGEQEEQRGGDLRVGVDHVPNALQAVVIEHHPVGGELIPEEALAETCEPDGEAQDGQGGDEE